MDHTVNIFYVCLVLLNIMSEISISVVACSSLYISFLHSIPLCEFTTIYPCIIDGRKVCFCSKLFQIMVVLTFFKLFFFFKKYMHYLSGISLKVDSVGS